MDIGEAEFEQPANEIASEAEARLPGIVEFEVRRHHVNRPADRTADRGVSASESILEAVRAIFARKA